MSSFTNYESATYLSQIIEKQNFTECQLDSRFKNTGEDMKDLLKLLLEFDPNKRLSAAELMKLEIFKDISDQTTKKEVKAAKKALKLPIDFEVPCNDQSVDITKYH